MIDRVVLEFIKMRSVSGHIDYNTQLGTSLGDRMSFDQTVPYTIACNFKGHTTESATYKFCLVEGPGSYSHGDAGTKVLLGKDVSVVLGDSHFDIFATTTFGDIGVSVNLYVGTPDDVLGDDTVYLYRFVGYVANGRDLTLHIPDISGFVVPTGKNVVCVFTSTDACYVNGHFVSSVDD